MTFEALKLEYIFSVITYFRLIKIFLTDGDFVRLLQIEVNIKSIERKILFGLLVD